MKLTLPMPIRGLFLVLCLGILSACGAPEVATQINDPKEEFNRSVHKINLDLDRAIVRPASNIYGEVLPQPVQRGVANVAQNLNVPGDVLNNLLQVRIGQAVQNTSRFLINSTLGIAGIFDVASLMGVAAAPTDFGETLYYWRVPEGSYAEMPIAGPATSRHAAGRIVDLLINPVSILVPAPENVIGTGVAVADAFGSRYRNSDLIDSVLYESADSYAQARLLYLQNRRFTLRGGDIGDDYFDPYEDPDAFFDE